MKLLVRRQLRYLLRARGATAASVFATALGVASIVAVHGVSERIVSRVQESQLLSGYTHIVGSLPEGRYFDLRERWRGGAAPAVEAMAPVLEGHVVANGVATPLSGIDWLALGRTGDGFGATPATAFELLAGATALASAGTGLAAGDAVRIGAPNLAELAIVGAFAGKERRLVADIATAQAALQRIDPTAVWIRAPAVSGWRWLDDWLPGASAAFGRATTIDLGDGIVAEALDRAEPTRRFAAALMFNLSALSCLALFVAAFLIYQSSYASVARRARDNERLLAIGVSQGRLRLLFVGEGALLGAIGAGLGAPFGWALAGLLADSPLWSAAPIELSAAALIKGVCGGVGVGAIGALAASQPKRRAWGRWASAAVALALFAAAAASANLAAAFGIILALCIMQIALITPAAAALANRWRVSRRAAPPVARRIPILARRASRRSLALQLREVGVAVSALSIAIAAAIGIDAMIESFRRDFAALLDRFYFDALHVDFVAPEQAGDDVMRWLRELPGVTSARRYGDADALLDGRPVRMRVGPDDALEASRFGRAETLGDAVLLSEAGARAWRIDAGASVRIDGGRGIHDARLAGRVGDYSIDKPRAFAAAQHWAPRLSGLAFDGVAVFTAPEPNAAAQRAAVARAIEDRFPQAQIRDHAALRARALNAFDRSQRLSSRLALIALGVAVAGLYAALAALQARRRNEHLLLHALGLERWQIAALAIGESVGIGIVAAVLAAPLGVAIAWVLCELVNPRAFGWSISFGVPLASVAWPLLLGIGAALLAGLAPALRTTRELGAPNRHAP